MPRSDPTNAGGLFIGRRAAAGDPTQRSHGALALVALVAVETLLSLTLWIAQPAGWVWIASRLYHETGYLLLSLLAALCGMIVTMSITLVIATRLDSAWVGRSYNDPRRTEGPLNTILVLTAVIAVPAFLFWLLVIEGPGEYPGIMGFG